MGMHGSKLEQTHRLVNSQAFALVQIGCHRSYWWMPHWWVDAVGEFWFGTWIDHPRSPIYSKTWTIDALHLLRANCAFVVSSQQEKVFRLLHLRGWSAKCWFEHYSRKSLIILILTFSLPYLPCWFAPDLFRLIFDSVLPTFLFTPKNAAQIDPWATCKLGSNM